MEQKYWNLFKKSGKVGDYLAFCEVRNAQNAALSLRKEEQHEEKQQGTDFKGTEYR